MSFSIRPATVEDLEKLLAGAAEFYASSKVLKRFDPDRFVSLWTGLLDNAGVIFLLEQDSAIAGALGGVVYPDAYSADLVATEFFWFVREGHRGRGGISLYRSFEDWARDRGAAEIRMVHLVDSMPDKLERFYTHAGFERAEVIYVKGL